MSNAMACSSSDKNKNLSISSLRFTMRTLNTLNKLDFCFVANVRLASSWITVYGKCAPAIPIRGVQVLEPIAHSKYNVIRNGFFSVEIDMKRMWVEKGLTSLIWNASWLVAHAKRQPSKHKTFSFSLQFSKRRISQMGKSNKFWARAFLRATSLTCRHTPSESDDCSLCSSFVFNSFGVLHVCRTCHFTHSARRLWRGAFG